MNGQSIFSLIKFAERGHAEALRAGKLYMNTWSHFRKLEGDEERGDPLEGTLHLLQASHAQILIGDAQKAVPLQALIGQIKISDANAEAYNIYCMFALTETSHEHLTGEAVRGLGNYAAVVTDGDAFLGRVRHKLIQDGLPFQHGLVSYVNVNRHHGAFGPFTKPDRHVHQSEFRIFVQSNRKSPLELEVGDLSDIVHVFPADELRWRFQPK